jgi:hypothetical protein
MLGSSGRDSNSLSEKTEDEKRQYGTHATTNVKEVDTAAQFSIAGGQIDPAESLRVRCVVRLSCESAAVNADTPGSFVFRRRKIDKHILPLMCSMLDLS